MSRKNFSKHHQRAVLTGQVWMRPSGYISAPWRVMAVAEGYAMGRYKGSMVSVVSVTEIDDEWRLCAETTEAGERT